jgi:hypothetical protein
MFVQPPADLLCCVGCLPACKQVGDGLTDFTPSPQESRAIIKAGYACPATLLVQFENDNFDETPEMQLLLSERQAGGSSSSSGGSAAAAADSSMAAGTGAGAAGGGQASAPQSGYTSAWNSIDEDVSMDNLLQQLQELQSSLAQQEQQRQPQVPGGAPQLQQLVLQGSHVTPCGAQLQGSLGPSPFDVLLSSSSNSGSPAELQNLARQVLSFLDSRRPQATLRRAAMQQQQAVQQQPQAAGAAGGGAGTEEESAAPAATAAAVAAAPGQGS